MVGIYLTQIRKLASLTDRQILNPLVAGKKIGVPAGSGIESAAPPCKVGCQEFAVPDTAGHGLVCKPVRHLQALFHSHSRDSIGDGTHRFLPAAC